MAKKHDEQDEVDGEVSGEVPAIDPWSVMSRMADALSALASRADASPSDTAAQQAIATLAAAVERLTEANVKGSKEIAAATLRAQRPSNQVIPGISVFNRRGTNLPDDAPGPRKQPLKCTMMIPWLAEWESLTREEVDLLNLLEPGEYMLKRIDNSKVRVIVRIDYREDGYTPSRLLLTHDTAFNNDNFKLLPPLTDILRGILRQHDPEIAAAAAAVLSDEEEEALIEAERFQPGTGLTVSMAGASSYE